MSWHTKYTNARAEVLIFFIFSTTSLVFIRAGIFIPETRRYYLTSHSGLWRLCRYSLVPTVLANSSAARNFTTLSLTNLTLANQLRQREASASYIADIFDNTEVPDRIVELDDTVRRALFAHWVRDNTGAKFVEFKSDYKRLEAREQAEIAAGAAAQLPVITTPATRLQNQQMLDPTDVTSINATIGAALSTVRINGTYINVIVPVALRKALFADWEEQPNVLLLLFAFAKDMEIPVYIVAQNGTRYIIQPPAPPKRGRVANGYEYKSFGECGGKMEMTTTTTILVYLFVIQCEFFHYFRNLIYWFQLNASITTFSTRNRNPIRPWMTKCWVSDVLAGCQ